MAVPEQTPYIEHTGNGVTTSFALKFQCESKDHLIVLIDDIEPPIASWGLVDGNVVFTTAPAAGKKIAAQRNTPFSRNVDYQSYNNSFRPPAVNKDFDWIWWKLQELGVADWILGARIDALKNYVDRKDDELKAYLMEEIRKQGVALDQLDEYYNYLMERLAQIAVDKGWDASFVTYNGQTQQKVNDGFSSIAEMLSITKPKNGMRIFVKGLQGGWFEYNASKSAINDGVIIFNGWVRITFLDGILPEWAGAPRDGVNDDADAIRKCIAYCETHGSKRIQLRNTGVRWIAGSVDTNNCAISIGSTGIIIDFETGDTEIVATTPMLSILYFRDAAYKFIGRNGTLLCANKANYGVFTLATKYTPQLSLEKMTVTNPIEDCVYLQTFIGDLSMLTLNGGKRGLVIRPVTGNITTSLNIRSCYALNQTVCGYDIDIACYCALIACAADNMPLAYKLNIRGGAMTACGAEGVAKIAEFVSFRGLSINGFYSQRCGSTDPLNPTPYLIEFVTGRDATISGLHIDGARNYTYKIGVTSPNYGYECVNVTDGFVKRDEAYFVGNFAYNRPIKFAYDDATQKDLTVNISTIGDLRKFITTYLNDYVVNHKLTIQLANGIYNFDLIVSTIQKITGGGEVIIQGNASDRTLVTLQTDFKRLVVKDCKANIRLKNLKLSSSASNGNNERLNVDNSQAVYLDNVLIARDGHSVGVGVRAINSSVVYITNGTVAESGAFTFGTFLKDATSRFVMDSAASAPTTLNWSAGMTVENTNPTTHLGWVFSGGAWKTYGAIT